MNSSETPPLLVWEVTPRCNLDCAFCYNVWHSTGAKKPAELQGSDLPTLINAIADSGPASVTLTGGEPLLRRDLEDIAAALSEMGILTGVATNGVLLTDGRAEALVRAGVSWFDVSVVSLKEEVYAELTGFHVLSEVKRSLAAVRRSGARLSVSHVVTSMNHLETAGVIDLANAFGAESVSLNRFVPGGRGKNSLHLLPDRNQLQRAVDDAEEAARNTPGLTVSWTIPVEPCLYRLKDDPAAGFGPCRCGSLKWALDPAGNLRTCEQNPEILGNLLADPLKDLACSPSAESFRGSDMSPLCKDCPDEGRCGGGCRFTLSP